MKRKCRIWLQVVALALAATLLGEATGATAALVITRKQERCCHQSQKASSCPVSWCQAGCGVVLTAVIPDVALELNVAAPRERWARVEQIGSALPAKPPVPPPRV